MRPSAFNYAGIESLLSECGDTLAYVKSVEGRSLRIASNAMAWRDLKRVGRKVGTVNATDRRW